MKKSLNKIILLTALLTISACNQPANKSNNSISSNVVDTSIADSKPVSAQNSDSKEQSSSSEANTSSGPEMRTDELYL